MIRQLDSACYPRLAEIWEHAVRATHLFLCEDDFRFFREHLADYFEAVGLWGYFEGEELLGFIGLSDDNVEMLFVDNGARGRGVGHALLEMAVNSRNIRKVDVNEQNPPALAFYCRHGFRIVGRSATDPSGRPYPILHLRL